MKYFCIYRTSNTYFIFQDHNVKFHYRTLKQIHSKPTGFFCCPGCTLYLSVVRCTRVRQDITIKYHVNKLRPLHTNCLVFMRLICKLVFEHYNLISNSAIYRNMSLYCAVQYNRIRSPRSCRCRKTFKVCYILYFSSRLQSGCKYFIRYVFFF